MASGLCEHVESSCGRLWAEPDNAVALRRSNASCRALRAASDNERMPPRLSPGLRSAYQGASCLVILRSAGHTHELLPWPFRGVLCRGSEQSALPESPLLPSAVRQTGSASGGVLAFDLASHGILSTGLGVLQGRAVSEMEKYGRSPFKRQFVEKFRMMALYWKTDMRN